MNGDYAFACRGLPPERFIPCMSVALEADREDRERQYDLHAQQDMAVWAAGILIVSVASFVVSFGGLALLLLNLQQQRRATEAAVAQVKAAERAEGPQLSVDVEPEAHFHRVLGFWGSVQGLAGLGAAKPEVRSYSLEVHCAVRNYGKSAAVHVHFAAEFGFWDIGDPPLEETLSDFCKRVRSRDGMIAVYPNETEPKILEINATIEKDAMEGWAETTREMIGLMPVVYGCISYRSPRGSDVSQIGFCSSVLVAGDDFWGLGIDLEKDDWIKKPAKLFSMFTRIYEERSD